MLERLRAVQLEPDHALYIHSMHMAAPNCSLDWSGPNTDPQVIVAVSLNTLLLTDYSCAQIARQRCLESVLQTFGWSPTVVGKSPADSNTVSVGYTSTQVDNHAQQCSLAQTKQEACG